jgi:hypothetical protein
MKNDCFTNERKTAAWANLIIALVCSAVAGCASKNVNPAHARNDAGYVDLFADEAGLYWKVDEVNGAVSGK